VTEWGGRGAETSPSGPAVVCDQCEHPFDLVLRGEFFFCHAHDPLATVTREPQRANLSTDESESAEVVSEKPLPAARNDGHIMVSNDPLATTERHC